MEFSTGMTILTVIVGILSFSLMFAIGYIGLNYFSFRKAIKKDIQAQVNILKSEYETLSAITKDISISALHYNTGMICKKQKEYELAFFSFAAAAKIYDRLKGKSTANKFDGCLLNLSYLVDVILEEEVSISYTKANYDELLSILSNIDHSHKNKILSFVLTHVKTR